MEETQRIERSIQSMIDLYKSQVRDMNRNLKKAKDEDRRYRKDLEHEIELTNMRIWGLKQALDIVVSYK